MRSTKTNILVAMVLGIVMATSFALCPIHSRPLQCGFFAGVLIAWLSACWLMRKRRWLRWVTIALPLVAAFPFLLPGGPIDTRALRDDYVRRVVAFDGTRYVWGGEASSGIDCSGLPRRALRDALWAEGMRHANGTAFRLWLGQWFFDEGATAMGKGYRERTVKLGDSCALWEMSSHSLLPGDLAVKMDHNHVVVYLGNGEWIEADPGVGRVQRWVPKEGDGPWRENMIARRWSVFDDRNID